MVSEDIEDPTRLPSKIHLPNCPPDLSTISPDILALNNSLATRYVGAASLISL